MSMQLKKLKEVFVGKTKADSGPPSCASNNNDDSQHPSRSSQLLEMPGLQDAVTAENIGEKLREGMQKRLKEHTLQRQAAGNMQEDSSEEEESPVNPRRVFGNLGNNGGYGF
jgi:hypothetical protein